MLNLEEIQRMTLVKAGEGLELVGGRRRVRLELNTAEPCQLVLQTGLKDMRFLANVHGRETITFIAEGDVTIWPDSEGEVWWFTPEMETTAVVIENPEIYTKIAEQRPRNVELERLMMMAQQNMERRFAHLNAELAHERAKVEALAAEERKRAKRKPTAAPPAASAGGESDPAGAASAAQTAGGTGGSDGSGGDADE